jgi:AAHS family 4-hydroxybenzoate transporter-like MFS transporter
MPDLVPLDVAAWIDRSRLGRLQVTIATLCGLAVLLDGFDAQVIGFVAPSIIREWQVPPASLAGVFSSALFGILVGCLLLAPLADWLGRRVVMLASVLVFAIASMATAWAPSLEALMLLRFLTGIGLGACMPNALALTSEYAPGPFRARLTSWMFTGFSLGAFVGGMLVARFVPIYGWRAMFLLGGILPLVLFLAMLALLPESVRHMAAHGASAERIARMLRRIDPSASFPPGTRFVMSEMRQPGLTVPYLFRDGRAAGTLLLWAMFFLMLLDVFLLASWTPTVLHVAGLSVTAAVVATALQQAGSVTATIVLGPLFDRFGFYRCLVPLLLAAAVAVIIMGRGSSNLLVLDIAAFVAGAGVMGGQTSLIVLAGSFYPTFIRATGVGWGLGVGRVGAIVGPLLGGLMVAAQWGPESVFLTAAIPAMLTAVLLLVMVRVAHVSPAGQPASLPA